MNVQEMLTLKPIGHMKSVFHFKNGTPRQSSLCENARGILTIDKSIFNNPEHSLDGLQDFSHAWILFMFHKNNNAHRKAKVKPPRLDGQRVGVFSTRSPYRPNNIGLSLAKIDKIQGASIHFSGIDILDGTPIIDIKPYIPDYDKPSSNNLPPNGLTLFTSAPDSSAPESNKITSHCSTEGTETSDGVLHGQNLKLEQNLNKEGALETTSPSVLMDSKSSKTQHDSEPRNVDDILSGSKELEFEGNANGANQDRLRDENPKASWPSAESISSDNPCDSVEKGLFSLSVASNKDSNTLKQSFDTTQSDISGTCIDYAVCQRKSTDTHTGNGNESEDDDLDCLVGNVICKAASDVLSLSVAGSSEQRTDRNKVEVGFNEGETTIVESVNTSNTNNPTVTAPWLSRPPVAKVNVVFSVEALQQLKAFHLNATDPRFKTEMLSGPEDAKRAISSILHEEPRSVYRRRKCQNSVYFFALDVLHVTCWFGGDSVTVLRVKPAADVPQLQEKGDNS